MDYLVIKDADMFLLTDTHGNIRRDSEKGLYTHDTRMLDHYVLTLNQAPLSLLQSSCDKGYLSEIHLTNKEEVNDGAVKIRQDSFEVVRQQVVYQGVFYERITVLNYARETLPVTLELNFGSRFQDIFEVRGIRRSRRGADLPPVVHPSKVTLGYQGLDNILRQIELCSQDAETRADELLFAANVIPGEPWVIEVAVRAEIGSEGGTWSTFMDAEKSLAKAHREWLEGCLEIQTDNAALNRMVQRGLTDLRVLLTDLGDGPFPVAGIPWFAVPFGRDSLIAAIQMLPFQPEIANGTLRTLARLQGTEREPWRAEEPGKILHEMRRGEMANLNEVPYGRYYGSIDSTPLFLILAVEYIQHTGNLEFLREILPNIKAAVQWLDNYADVDGDGLIEYHVESSGGLSVQSWKDSYDSMIHLDGQLAQSPMAVVEVQGYVYHAKFGLSTLLKQIGENELGERLVREATDLKEVFNERFWMPDTSYFALALDKDKRQVKIKTSDVGHALWSDIIAPKRVQDVVDTLMGEGLFSGWGIRTVSSEEAVFSPISYHNGSVWSHDNSLILLGFAKQGCTAAVNRLCEGLIRASQEFEYQRLPELFCGHDAGVGNLVRYPVACIPQAWAAGTPLAVVQGMLGLQVDGFNRTIRLQPTWPDMVSHIEVKHMPVGQSKISLSLDKDHGLSILESNGWQIELHEGESGSITPRQLQGTL